MNRLVRASVWLFALTLPTLQAEIGAPLSYIELANGQRTMNIDDLVQWTHARAVFDRPLRRVAVGKDAIAEVDVLDDRELLILAKTVGNTSMMIWFEDGTNQTYMLRVVSDISFLENALRAIDPGISIEMAPDRPVLLLTGSVEFPGQKAAAERAALSYITGRSNSSNRTSSRDVLNALVMPADTPVQRQPLINLIQVRHEVEPIEDRVIRSLQAIGTTTVRVRRIRGHAGFDGTEDTLLLEGDVQSQAELSRVLAVVSRLYVRPDQTGSLNGMVQVYSDQGGRVVAASAPGARSGASGATAGRTASTAELARANVLSIAGGRVLSMIKVLDVPQLRVSVQMYEINLNRFKEWQPGLSAATATSSSLSLPGSNTLEAAIRLFSGALAGEIQIAGQDASFNALFSMLESEGIARTLSKPTITLMSGESGDIQVGGEIPVRSTYTRLGQPSDSQGTGNDALVSQTEFKPYGIQLSVGATIDETDHIELRLNPRVSTPNTLLSKHITDSTGSSQSTTAFDVRSMNTTNRLRDGQPLVIGGLVSRDRSDSAQALPVLGRLPVVGRLFRSDVSSYQERELVIVVTPTIVREPKHQVSLWEFVDSGQLLDWALGPYGSRANTSIVEEETP